MSNMKTNNTSFTHWVAAALLSAALLAFTSCSTTDGTEEVDLIETPDGGIIVDTVTTTATVTAIDSAKRKVTLMAPNGQKINYKCGPEVVNFAQIQVGDQVKATVTEEAAVFIGQGAPPSAVVGAGVSLAPVGYKPGGALVESAQVSAKVTAVDTKKHKVTLQFPEGISRKVKVGKQVNLAAVRPGDDVTIQLSEGFAISVAKP